MILVAGLGTFTITLLVLLAIKFGRVKEQEVQAKKQESFVEDTNEKIHQIEDGVSSTSTNELRDELLQSSKQRMPF